jgi:multiple sugar transport system substrate-binding protein
MRPFRVIPKFSEWNDIFWNQYEDPVFHKKGTPEELAKAVRPKLEAVLPK